MSTVADRRANRRYGTKGAVALQSSTMSVLQSTRLGPTRLLVSLVIPILAYFLIPLLLSGGGDVAALRLAAVGITSLFVGFQWYRAAGMGLRGHRALYAGIGFAALAWLIFLLARYATVQVADYVGTGLGRTFIYLLLFEAFAVQLWVFGLVFRSLAEWRGPLTAAAGSGLLFGLAAFLTFKESFVPAAAALLYFIVWGVLYGIIRLRTGSWLGLVVVQAMQSLTAWFLLAPTEPPALTQLRTLYIVSSLLYILLIWRLWPRREEDYRV
jgi:hypothetical protein